MKYLLLVLGLTGFVACQTSKEWKYKETIHLEEVNPVGITIKEKEIWLSDTDRQRLVVTDKKGQVLQKKEGFDRPMHLDVFEDTIYISNYGSNQILSFVDAIDTVGVRDSLDGPSGIAVSGKKRAIADFYKHRVLFFDGYQWMQIGKKGTKDGQFHYPTDVQITNNKIYVADAYNHRVQVFDFHGEYLFQFGKEEQMNASTGLYVKGERVFVTDFENGRVLIYSLQGKLQQIISEGIHSPTDVIVEKGRMMITNYKEGELVIYK